MRGAICAWCGKGHDRRRQGVNEPSSCCSRVCDQRYAAHGYGASHAEIKARVAHIAQQPKGHSTVESFLAAGGIVYREDAGPQMLSRTNDHTFGAIFGGRAR